MKTTVSVNKEAFEKLKAIKLNRPQDITNADTFDYILRVFEESPLRITEKNHPLQRNAIAGNVTSPIIDADNPRIVTPSTLADKLTRDALKTTSNAIRKAYPSEESKE
jgi:hypothetical protein